MRRKKAALLLAGLFCITAAAGPFLEKQPFPVNTVSAEEEYPESAEEGQLSPPAEQGTWGEISYSRPEEESTYGPTGAASRIDLSALAHRTEDEAAPVVYFTDNISPQGLLNIYHALGVELDGNIAVKVSTGEAGNNHYLNPNLVKDLVWELNGTIVECNTAPYGGMRAATEMHYQVAADHGWTEVASVEIMDEFGTTTIPVNGGSYLTEDVIGGSLDYYDSVLVLSHFKGHGIAGFGGALKNVAIGMSAPEGKSMIHSAGADRVGFTQADQISFTACMAEAAKAIYEFMGNDESMLFINVMNNLSVDCDCVGDPNPPTMANVGILASTDPVALDQACVDIVYAAPDSGDMRGRIEARSGVSILDHCEQIGFGSRYYRLQSIDG